MPPGADAVWTKPSLDEPEYAAFGEHRVGHDQEYDRESHGDGYELESDVEKESVNPSIADCRLPIADWSLALSIAAFF